MDAHALLVKTVRDGPVCTLILSAPFLAGTEGCYEAGGTEAVPHPPVRASLAHPGASPLYDRGTPYPPWGPAVLPGHRPPGSEQHQAAGAGGMRA